MTLYLFMKWLHVLLAIVALGVNLTYSIWLFRAAQAAGRVPEVLPFTLRGIKILDDRVANPSYGLLLVTGVLMVINGGLEITTPWILISLVLYAILVLVGLLGYTPTLRRQIQVAEAAGRDTQEYVALDMRGRVLGIVLGVLAVAIVFLMVVKPGL